MWEGNMTHACLMRSRQIIHLFISAQCTDASWLYRSCRHGLYECKQKFGSPVINHLQALLTVPSDAVSTEGETEYNN